MRATPTVSALDTLQGAAADAFGTTATLSSFRGGNLQTFVIIVNTNLQRGPVSVYLNARLLLDANL